MTIGTNYGKEGICKIAKVIIAGPDIYGTLMFQINLILFSNQKPRGGL